MKPHGVIFDLDGTLYRMPWYFKPVFFVRLFPHGGRLPAYMRVRDAFAGKECGSGTQLTAQLSAALAQRVRIDSGVARTWIEESFYPRFAAMMGLVKGSRPGLGPLLAALRASGSRTAVLSDFAWVEQRLARLGIAQELFDACGSSEEAGALKPSPRPFLAIADGWGLSPSEVIVVGDRDDTDGAGARAAGMRFVNVGSTGVKWADLRRQLGQ